MDSEQAPICRTPISYFSCSAYFPFWYALLPAPLIRGCKYPEIMGSILFFASVGCLTAYVQRFAQCYMLQKQCSNRRERRSDNAMKTQ